jgi:cytochrome c553
MASHTDRAVAALAGALAALVALAGAPAAADDAAARGEELYALCAQCHGERGDGNPAALAPAIAGLDRWYVEAQLEKFRSGVRGAHPEDVGGLRMRPMSMWLEGPEDVKAVAGHVAGLPPADPAPTLSGDPARGAQTYTLCVACHLPDGKGSEPLNAPSLVHASDWYLVKQLHNYKAGVRGARPDDATGALMRPMAMTLADDQAIQDVVAYIMTLRQQGQQAQQNP